MKIIILGAGQVGGSVADHLVGEGNDVTLVDSNDAVLRTLQDRLDLRTVHGDASQPSVLAQAGAEDADMLLAVTASDETNIVACQVAYTLFHTPTKIARIRSSDYLHHKELFGPKAIPIDVLISPEQIVTNQIMHLIEHPDALQVLDFADGRIQLVGIRALTGGPLVGHALRELKDHMPTVDTRVAAIYRQDRAITPVADTVIEADDEVFFVAARRHIRTVMSELRKLDKPGRRIMLAGGGNIGLHLARDLEQRGYNVKLIERDAQRAGKVAEILGKAVVLHGDAADEELLRSENIHEVDVFCSLTNEDEANILSAMLAKRLGAHRVVAIVNRSAYVDLIHSNVLDVAFSPKLATVGSLLAHIRRGDVVAVHSLRRGAAEALEAVAHGDEKTSRVVGRCVRDVKLPPGAVIGAIVRDGDVVLPHQGTVIESDDHLILFVADKRQIPAVERLFQVAVTFI
ncbi:MAG: Trk system potassium transporter TrkA [Gammaproteobacteria bacterium]|nr:Trk system potassium transporter TrkA [Gammaproteobacteria bacterium]